jgi:hypothetical protein
LEEVEREEAVRVFERMDEEQIVSELTESSAFPDYVYEYEVNGKKIIGISIAGVRAIVQRKKWIEIREWVIEKDSDLKMWHATVKVRDAATGLEALGTASCEMAKPFSRTIALNKALRNAWRHLIDDESIRELIREYRNMKRR